MPITSRRCGTEVALVRSKLVLRDLFELSDAWTMADIIDGVADAGVIAKPKEVYNAVGYMTRKGLIRRTNYGQYVKDATKEKAAP